MNARTRWMRVDLMLSMGAFILAAVAAASAQVQTTTNTTEQPSTQQVQVENAEVLYVKGNDLILRMSDGSIRHVSNVPDSARATVDGQEIGIKDVKVGMKLQKTTITTTTPTVVTTVQTVKGKVFHVQSPNSVILTLENGENQQFEIPKGQKFMVDGEEKDAWGLKKGMMVSATRIVEEPITVMEQEIKVSGQMPPPPPAPAADLPILVAVGPPPVPPKLAEEAKNEPPTTEKELPQTGSELPLLALLGSLSFLGAALVRISRRIRS
jgi:LPXTG-motif cell wall-anchored protein